MSFLRRAAHYIVVLTVFAAALVTLPAASAHADDLPPKPVVNDYPGIAHLEISPANTQLDQPYPLCLGPIYAGNPQSQNQCKQFTLTLTSGLPYCENATQVDCIAEANWGHTNGSLPYKSGGPSDLFFIWWPAVAGSSPDCAGGLGSCDRFFLYGANAGRFSGWITLANPEIRVRRPLGSTYFYEFYEPQAAVYVKANGPTAAFNANVDPAHPGDVSFTNTSSDSGGQALTSEWDFGDGSAKSTATSPTHHYDKPGNYNVSLKVKNADGITSSASKSVAIAAPTLTTAITFLEGKAPPFVIGDAVTARITVTASNGLGNLKNIKFNGANPLAVNPAASFTKAGNPTPVPDPNGFTLAPGASTSFDIPLQAATDGTYTLTSAVTGMNDSNQFVTGTSSVTGEIQRAALAIESVTLSTDRPQVDGEFTADIAARATGKDVTNAKLAVPTVSPAGRVELLEGPTPASTSIPANTTKHFTVKLKAKTSGDADLGFTVSGTNADGPVSDTAHKTAQVQSGALQLTLKLSKGDDPITEEDGITLDEDNDGPKKQTIDLTIEAKNISPSKITDVTLLSIQPAWKTGLPFTSTLPSNVLHVTDGPGSSGTNIGAIEAGETVTKKFHVEVLDDGHLTLNDDATYVDGDANGFASGSVALVSKPKYLLRLRTEADASVDDNPADPWNPPDAVGAGRNFLVTGQVKNLTTDQRVIARVLPENVKQLSTVQLGDLAKEWDNPAMPYVVQLDGGESQALQGHPIAIPNPAKDGSLTFTNLEYSAQGKHQIVDDDDQLTAFDMTKVLTSDEERKHHIAVAWPPPEPPPTAIELYGLFSKAFIETSASWWASLGTSALSAYEAIGHFELETFKVITGDPEAQALLRQRIASAWAGFTQTVDLARQTLANMTPAEKAQLLTEITNPILLSLKISKAIVTNEQVQAATKAIGAAVAKTWDNITNLGLQDPRQLAQTLGSGSALVFNEVTVGIVSDAAIAKLIGKFKYGKNLEAAQKFVDDAAAAKTAEGLRIDKGLKGIPAGAALTDEVLTVGLGVTKAEAAQMSAVAKRFNLVVYARSRGAEASELIKKGLARLKPFGVDAKNVNDIDRLLGFPEALKDTVAIKKPKAWSDVVASGEYKALDAEQRAQVASRWETRSKEWNGGGKLKQTSPGEWTVSEHPPDGIGAERQKFLDAAKKKTFDLQFPTAGNWEEVAVDGQALGTARAEFGLKTTVDETGAEILQPLMNDAKGGKLLPITGDVDLVALLNPDGTWPSPQKIIDAYIELAKPPLRMQHPATWSFGVAGKSQSLLADHLLGGATAEPLAAFGPLGDRTAVLFDKTLSLVPNDRANNAALFVKVAGGIKLPTHAYGLGALVPWGLNPDPKGKPYYTPEDWQQANKSKPNAAPNAQRVEAMAMPTPMQAAAVVESTSGVRFTRGAKAVEQASPTRLVAWNGTAWVTWTPPATGSLNIAPQSCVSKAVAVGARTINVCSLSQLFANTGSGGQAWFAAGDEITLDLGGSQSWTTTVTAVSATTIAVADAAPTSYTEGTVVHLTKVATTDVDPTDDDGNGGSGTGNTDGAGTGSGGGTTGAGDPSNLPYTGSEPIWLQLAIAFLAVGFVILQLTRAKPRTRSRMLRIARPR